MDRWRQTERHNKHINREIERKRKGGKQSIESVKDKMNIELDTHISRLNRTNRH